MADEVMATDSGTKFTPHPEGAFPALCVDVINLGQRVETFQGKIKVAAKLALVFRTGQRRDDGEYFEIAAEFTNSMNEKAALRKFMEAWRGKAYTDEQVREGVPVHKMEAQRALVNVMHQTSKSGRQYAKIGSVMRLPAGMELPETGDYKRADYWQERKDAYAEELRRHLATTAPHDDYTGGAANGEDDDDLPF
jgi:hypothetical protein